MKAAALSLALCIGAAAPTAAEQPSREPASDTVPEPPAPPDVIVRGRALGELRLRVQLAEEAVFARFNDINSSDDFDIHCRAELPTGSHIARRVCSSNSWREQDTNYAQASLARMRGEAGPPAEQFLAEQRLMQRRLAEEVRRLALEDEGLREAIVDLGRAQLTLAERTGTRSEWTAWREVAADTDGLPFQAERMFEVHVGRQRWDHLLERRTFTIAQVTGTIRALDVDCKEGSESLDYEPGLDWTLPAAWTSCILSVRAKPDTTFALYEF